MLSKTQSQVTFTIAVGGFNGSLETLLSLIQKRKLHISEVSLSQVTDEYLSHIKSLNNINQQEIAEFLVIATTLLLIKSKSLLPNFELSLEEEEDMEELEYRLRLYKIYQTSREILSKHLQNNLPLIAPVKSIKIESTPREFKKDNITIQSLSDIMQELIDNLPLSDVKDNTSISKTINIKAVMDNLLSKIKHGASENFVTFTKANKEDVLINFLALLELVKEGVLLVEQESLNNDILISRNHSVI